MIFHKLMNDNASLAVGGQRSGLGGLPQRLVQDGVVEEAAMLDALNVSRERKTSVVTQLVTSGAAKARDIAIAAAPSSFALASTWREHALPLAAESSSTLQT